MAQTLRPPKAPNLLVGPVAYEQNYQNQLNNAQRLYYNQIDNTLTVLLENSGGRYLNFPHISASDSTSQYASASNTATLTNWNTLETGEGFTLYATYAVADYSGVYKIDYSLQFANSDNAAHNITVWLRINGVDVPRSASIFTVPARKSVGVYGYTIAVSLVEFSVVAGAQIQLYWATDQAASSGGATGVFMEAVPAQTSPYAHPASPSAIGAITFVSELSQ